MLSTPCPPIRLASSYPSTTALMRAMAAGAMAAGAMAGVVFFGDGIQAGAFWRAINAALREARGE